MQKDVAAPPKERQERWSEPDLRGENLKEREAPEPRRKPETSGRAVFDDPRPLGGIFQTHTFTRRSVPLMEPATSVVCLVERARDKKRVGSNGIIKLSFNINNQKWRVGGRGPRSLYYRSERSERSELRERR